MLAELASVRVSQSQWRFALGCAATALGESMKFLGARVLGVADEGRTLRSRCG
jgi:hypothetical protein